ncbi:MAG: hypothetical protein PVS2B2_00400 [Candidatus Acidiferrum sp.]
MKFAARMIVTMAAAFFLVPALLADATAKPAHLPGKAASANSTAVPGVLSKPEPAASSRQTPAGRGMGMHSERHGRRAAVPRNTIPKVELFMGYSYWRAVPKSTGNRIDAMHGGSTSLTFNVKGHLGVVFEFGGFRVNSLQFNSPGAGFSPSRVVDASGNVFTLLAGPRISFRNHDRLTPFLQVLGGLAHADEVTLNGCNFPIYACTPLPRERTFALTAGGGLDYALNHRFALRLFQAEFLLTKFHDPTVPAGKTAWQNNMRLSSGIIFRFGGNHPPPAPPSNRSPVVSCSVDRNTVYAGSGDMATVHAVASDPDNDPLSYSWTTNGGAVEGGGPAIRWNSSGATPGTYTVKSRVEDGRGGTADCSTEIRLEPRPNRPPTISCSADRTAVVIGEPVQITSTAGDPDNDPLSYSWTSSGGHVRGRDSSAKFDTAGLQAGRYSVTGHVDDGRGGGGSCTSIPNWHSATPPPEMVELEKRLDLHSIYFQTSRSTVANPNAGLVRSQEKILATLTVDFKRYQTFRPEAHLILGGHADERGSEEYNKTLTQRRVERTRNFLVEHGVIATAIETRSFGKDDQLSAAQIKEQIGQNEDLTPDDRQEMLDNLQVMVLANNRRVDVALSTTRQRSTHHYPFNAKDYLALISTKGGEKSPPVRRKSRR